MQTNGMRGTKFDQNIWLRAVKSVAADERLDVSFHSGIPVGVSISLLAVTTGSADFEYPEHDSFTYIH
jgi:hypothetical protein